MLPWGPGLFPGKPGGGITPPGKDGGGIEDGLIPAEGGPEALVLESVVLFNYAVTGHGIYFMTQPDSRASKKLIQFLSCGDQTTKIIASTDLDVYCWPRRLAG